MTDAKLRKTFEITKRRPDLKWPGYEVRCLIPGCGWVSNGWDRRSNALFSGRQHARSHD